MKKAGLVLLFIGIAFLPALSAVFVNIGGWYEALNKPSWNPPSWIFGPVWSTLYLMIGLAGYLAWTRGCREERRAVFTAYGAQLLLNALWSPVFFGLHRPDSALIVLTLLWFSILICIGAFSQRSRLAAWLMIPYFLWVSFAGALNTVIAAMN
ncbi:MAG: tryptophan-rich sensory protein [Kiritimatiellaceae bacterium]|nr:tryptophan-rich sensory protein [Kiritimatiellaceae bacterium]